MMLQQLARVVLTLIYCPRRSGGGRGPRTLTDQTDTMGGAPSAPLPPLGAIAGDAQVVDGFKLISPVDRGSYGWCAAPLIVD
jgi:hypothetical protein